MFDPSSNDISRLALELLNEETGVYTNVATVEWLDNLESEWLSNLEVLSDFCSLLYF